MKPFEIFCACPPGLEPYLQAEALEGKASKAQKSQRAASHLWVFGPM